MTESLCSQEKLDAEQVKLQKSLVRRGSTAIGMVIRVEGPRLMRSHAIWIERENRILFYDSSGKRFSTVQLAESPELANTVV